MNALRNSGDATLDFDDLPLRAHALDPDDLSDVFGGCQGFDEHCDNACTCCEGLRCSSDIGGSCYRLS